MFSTLKEETKTRIVVDLSLEDAKAIRAAYFDWETDLWENERVSKLLELIANRTVKVINS